MTFKTWISAAAAVATVGGGMAAAPAQAQTAADINRLNQAMQICNSPLGASVPECAQLRGQLGVGAGLGALLGGGQQQQQQPFGNPANAAAAQQAYVACVQRAGVNQQMLTACNLALQTQMGAGNFAQQGANATVDAAAAYRACVARNPAAWQSCMAAFGSGAPSVGNVPPPPAPARPAAPYDPFAPPRP